MSLELIKEKVKATQVLGNFSAQNMIESDIIVPDTKTDVLNILSVNGNAIVTDVNIEERKVVARGNILYKILYKPEASDSCVESITTKSSFSHTWDVVNATPQTMCRVVAGVENIDYEILNGRKINLKTALNLSCSALNEEERETISEISGDTGLQLLKKDIDTNYYINIPNVDHCIRECISIPASKPSIREILSSYITVMPRGYRIDDEQVIAEALLDILVLYIGDDEDTEIHCERHSVPVSCPIDLAEVDESLKCWIDYQVVESTIQETEDSDGELRNLDCEIALNILVDGYYNKTISVVEDAYSINSRLSLEKQAVPISQILDEYSAQVSVKDIIAIPSNNPDLQEIFGVWGEPVICSCRCDNNVIAIEGIISSTILYRTTDTEHPVYSYQYEIPFKHSIKPSRLSEIDPEVEFGVSVNIENCDYDVSSNHMVSLRQDIGISVRLIVNNAELVLTENAIESPIREDDLNKNTSLLIYFVQKDDTLWEVAKRYGTTVDTVQKINGLDELSTLESGQQLMICKI